MEISLAVTLDKMRNAGGHISVYATANLRHREQFCVAVFKELLKFSHDCQLITKNVIIKDSNLLFK